MYVCNKGVDDVTAEPVTHQCDVEMAETYDLVMSQAVYGKSNNSLSKIVWLHKTTALLAAYHMYHRILYCMSKNVSLKMFCSIANSLNRKNSESIPLQTKSKKLHIILTNHWIHAPSKVDSSR